MTVCPFLILFLSTCLPVYLSTPLYVIFYYNKYNCKQDSLKP